MSSSPKYRIKPLVWGIVCHSRVEFWSVGTIIGSLNVWQGDRTFHWECSRHGRFGTCESIEAGKAAAEAYYRERILPALEAVE